MNKKTLDDILEVYSKGAKIKAVGEYLGSVLNNTLLGGGIGTAAYLLNKDKNEKVDPGKIGKLFAYSALPSIITQTPLLRTPKKDLIKSYLGSAAKTERLISPSKARSNLAKRFLSTEGGAHFPIPKYKDDIFTRYGKRLAKYPGDKNKLLNQINKEREALKNLEKDYRKYHGYLMPLGIAGSLATSVLMNRRNKQEHDMNRRNKQEHDMNKTAMARAISKVIARKPAVSTAKRTANKVTLNTPGGFLANFEEGFNKTRWNPIAVGPKPKSWDSLKDISYNVGSMTKRMGPSLLAAYGVGRYLSDDSNK